MHRERTMKFLGKISHSVRKREAKFIEKFISSGPVENFRNDSAISDILSKF